MFYEQAVELYKARPLETRYTIKFRHSEGKLVLKVTDDRTVRSLSYFLHNEIWRSEPLNQRLCGCGGCLGGATHN